METQIIITSALEGPNHRSQPLRLCNFQGRGIIILTVQRVVPKDARAIDTEKAKKIVEAVVSLLYIDTEIEHGYVTSRKYRGLTVG